ncbi:M56 family metallopeptidase [Niabella aurantiaca]|uniref:M56 family metallopeptidase n=1 Tax=Niabella aurantiaca TaxID=379900 RepID=UPI00037B3368|nr:M56 family metallopeptidase [Niabella aurantiaca]
MQYGLYHVFTALGNALFSSVWQMGIIWLLITLYTYLRPSNSDASNSLLRFAGLVSGFVLFLITFFTSLDAPQANRGLLKWMIHLEWLRPLLNYGAILYLALLVLPLRNILKNSFELRRLRRTGTGRVPGALKIFMLDAAGYLNIKRKVQLYTSSIISSPLTLGFLKPVILIPVALINQLTPQQLEAILLHELAHIKRNDYFFNLVTQIIITFLYFNPFARLLVKAQDLDREKSADQWVLRFEYGQSMYASTLLQLARNQFPGNGFTMQASGKESQLGNRVASIMGSVQKTTLPFKKIGLLACMLLLSGGFYLTRSTRPMTDRVALAATNSLPASAIAEARYIMPVAAKESAADSSQEKYSIQPIPVIDDPDARPGDNALYLKIAETPDGKIQAPAPPPAATASEPLILFADHPTIIVPALDSAAEEKVQQSMDAFKKLVTELSWKHMENSLAETVTEQQKKALKDKLSRLIDQVNWEQNANMLRSFYKDINWQQADDQLRASLDALFHAGSARQHGLKQKEYRRLADSLFSKAGVEQQQKDHPHSAPRTKDSLQDRKVVAL